MTVGTVTYTDRTVSSLKLLTLLGLVERGAGGSAGGVAERMSKVEGSGVAVEGVLVVASTTRDATGLLSL